MFAKVILLAKKQQKIMDGHPWVFPQAIHHILGHPQAGDWVWVSDDKQNIIGAGFYNPNSLYRVRMIANKQLLDSFKTWQEIVTYQLHKAIQLRQTMRLPNENTTAYRLCNSENDGLSGIVVDIFHDVVVVSSTALWVEQHRDFITQILKQQFPQSTILWFGQPKPLTQEGCTAPYRDTPKNLKTTIFEGGVQFEIHFNQIQKTGIYIDQRENHQRLAQLCKGKKVLDLYTYHGGFALHAAKAGANGVTAVDSSAPAIEHAKRNAELNHVTIDWQVADAKEYLEKVSEYDVISLDPPKLIPSKKHLNAAKNLYRFLHRQVFRNMRSGCILMTSNCSSALNTQEFVNLVQQQALLEHKSIQILGIYGPSICHPVLPVFPEGQYLTAILLVVM